MFNSLFNFIIFYLNYIFYMSLIITWPCSFLLLGLYILSCQRRNKSNFKKLGWDELSWIGDSENPDFDPFNRIYKILIPFSSSYMRKKYFKYINNNERIMFSLIQNLCICYSAISLFVLSFKLVFSIIIKAFYIRF